MLRRCFVLVGVLALAGCSSGGFEAVNELEGDALAIFPEGGFYDPEAACTEYVTRLNEQQAEASSVPGGYFCRAR